MMFGKKTLVGIANESIDFQDGRFFHALVKDIAAIRADARDLIRLTPKRFNLTPQVKKLLTTIKEFTGLMVVMENGEDSGPAMGIPFLNANHVLFDDELRETMDLYRHFNPDEDLEFTIGKVMKALGTKVIKGEVDLKASKVTGAFTLIENPLYYPMSMLLERTYSCEENAAIILHELGHAFTFMEYATRTVSTNQAISTLTRVLDKSITYEKRVVIFERAAEQMKLDKVKTEALKNAGSAEQITVIVMDSEIEDSISELGFSIYDVNSCEYLADQFAARHGAGVHIVTGLDKLIRSYGTTRFIFMLIEWVFLIIAIIATFGLLIPFWLLGLVFGPSKEEQIYDNEKSRFIRVKLQLVERLKDVNLSPKLRENLIEEVKVIDEVAKHYNDNLGFSETIAYYLRPGYRNAHKYEMLQKDLERIGSSDLFVAAGKLKNV